MIALAMIAVFAVAVAYDYLFAMYVRYAAAKDAPRAALASGATYAVGLVGMLAVTQASVWFALPEIVGLALGTYLGILRGGEKK